MLRSVLIQPLRSLRNSHLRSTRGELSLVQPSTPIDGYTRLLMLWGSLSPSLHAMLLIVVLIKIICHEFLNKLNKLSTLLSWVFGLFGEKSVIRIIFMLILYSF